jgi:phosphomannomutase
MNKPIAKSITRKSPLNHWLSKEIVRAYDIRGTYGNQITSVEAYFIGRAFAEDLRDLGGHTVAVGYDGRHSSPELEASLVRGLSEGGAEVVRIGLGPTPLLYYAVQFAQLDAGIMISGSHNAPEYNGFKFTLRHRPYFGEDLKRLATRISTGLNTGSIGNISEKNFTDSYVNRLFRCDKGKRALNIVWDPGHGASAPIVNKLVALLPGNHKIINGYVDGDFPSHHPDPTVPENLKELRQIVRNGPYDLGLAFDGDGDRLGVVDSKGEIVWADQLLTLFSIDLLKRHPDATIIADVKTSQTFFDQVAEKGGNPIMWKTGHSLIKSKMSECNAMLAGEMSGHIFFADSYYGFDDALYAAIRLVSLLANSPIPLAKMCAALPKAYATPEIRISCPENQKKRLMKRIRRQAEDSLHKEIFAEDGVRVMTERGWWLVRASNTEPVLVARCEGHTPVDLERLTSQLKRHLSSVGLIFPDTTNEKEI